MPTITNKTRNVPSSLPTQRVLRVDIQDGPWSVSVAETPHDALSYTIYIKTPTHNLTLTRTVFEVVELDEKLRDAHPGVTMPTLPLDLSSLPAPPKRKSAFLNTLTRLASPNPKAANKSGTPSKASQSQTNGATSPITSPTQEISDPFSSLVAEAELETPPNNATITALAAYLTTISNDQIHRQTRVWKRFVRVRTDDLESVRVERAIKRVRSDLAAHLAHTATDMSAPSVSDNGSDTVMVHNGLSDYADPEEKLDAPEKTDIPPEQKAEDESKPAAVDPTEATETTEPAKAPSPKQDDQPELPASINTSATPASTAGEEEDEEVEATPVQAGASPSHAPSSPPADTATHTSNGRAETRSQTSATTGDESSVSGSQSRSTRKKRSRSEDPNKPKKRDVKSSRKVLLEDFEMMRVLGKGCAGKVLLVRHKATTDLFALKAITKRHVLAHQELQHTLTEQAVLKRMAAQGKDPFVVKLWWSFHDKEHLFLVMDFHPGGDLATQLARWGRLGRDRARFYAAEIVEGCEGLHENGVIYRDLKPENVLIGGDGHIVLTDFGLSKEFPRKSVAATAPSTPNGQRGEFFASTPETSSANGSPSLKGGDLANWPAGQTETTTTFCGTAEYLAPEVIQGLPYSFEVDWWSFGTMLYEMLTGITPFWANNHSDMYLRVLQDELQFPEDRSMDQDTKSLLRGLLQRNPALRIKEPRIKKHPYFSMIDWSHVYHKRYIPPYIPPIDPSNASDTQNFDETFLDMEPVIKDEDDLETEEADQSQSETDQGEGEDDEATTPGQSRTPSRAGDIEGDGELDMDVFDGYSFKGRHSVLIDDDEEEEGSDEDEEEEEEGEEASGKSLRSKPESVAENKVDVEGDGEEAEPKTPEAKPAKLAEPVDTNVPAVPPKDVPQSPARSTTKEVEAQPPTPSKSPSKSPVTAKPPTPSKSAAPATKQPATKPSKQRREKSGIAALDAQMGDSNDESIGVTDREEEDDWDMVEAGDEFEKNGAKGTSLFARGVVDRYKLAVFRPPTKKTSSGGVVPGPSDSDYVESPAPSEKQSRGRTAGLNFRKQKLFGITPPSSFSGKSSTGKSKSARQSSTSMSTKASSSTAVNPTATPSLKSKQSAVSMTSPSESSDQSPNEETTRPGPLSAVMENGGKSAPARKLTRSTPQSEEPKKKKKYKGAEKVLSIFASPR